ncbi:Amino-acid carrier protein AlsT [Planctomycetes bacterium Poly30]|uniref:Amino-acid carrier protein AlsT n=1 Tax=Saltatorellus ferox TaxID=2528018 RepID=A0A518EP31_9BACT|nr:Amino-acid carrier protein AlsT [Planctomycetes bacterium Poly30]
MQIPTLETINAFLDGIVNVPVFGVPLLVLWLAAAGLAFTVWMRFINVRAFGHALSVAFGKHDRGAGAAEGDVSHAQALWTALSGTLGLGNIAGVVIAIGIGGPGATFWMVLCGFFGMTLKFTECSLGQMYRIRAADGSVSGGPMHYLPKGLAEQGWPRLGRALGAAFAGVCIFSSFGAGNLFQITQATAVLREVFPGLEGQRWVLGAAFAVIVAAVTLGGLKSIARVAGRIVPAMCALYLVVVIVILATHASEVPAALASIWRGALSPGSAYGGFVGVLVAGMTRATFSNEAGTGSAAIAHAAATTDEPIRGGIVALLEPFIDTVVVCTMTATMILVLDPASSSDPAVAAAMEAREGATALLLLAGEVQPWSRLALVVAITSFALSTVLTWSYYGERCVRHFVAGSPLKNAVLRVYQALFVAVVFAGALVEASSAQQFADMAFLSLAFPNVLGLYLLAPIVRRRLDEYLARQRNPHGSNPPPGRP